MADVALEETRFADNEEIGPLLYHYPHSFASEVVRLALAEKGVPWHGRVVDIGPEHANYRPWYMGLNPRGVVPTLKADSRIICGTWTILDHIETTYPGPTLMPAETELRDLADRWIERGLAFPDRELAFVSARFFSPILWRLDMPRRRQLLEAHRSRAPDLHELYDAKLKDLADWRASVSTADAKTRHVATATAMLDELEGHLADGRDWIAGTYSMADVVWTCVLARLVFFHLGDHVSGGSRPRVAEYLSRVRGRVSFAAAPVYTEWDPMVTLPSLFRVMAPWLMGLAVVVAFLIWTLL